MRLRNPARPFVAILKDASLDFFEDRVRRLSAGLAYYALFALVPTLLLSASIAAAFVGREAAAGELGDQLSDVLGPESAAQIENAMGSLWESTDSSAFALFSIGVILFSASVLFSAWRDTVQLIWEVPYEPSLKTTLRTKLFAVLVPIFAGFFLVVTLILQGAMTFVQEFVSAPALDTVLRVGGSALQFALGVAALGFLYSRSTTVGRPEWVHIWPATLMVDLVLMVGFWGYGLYLRFVGTSSVTGAASSVVLGLVVIYYTAQVLLFGAEVIKVAGRDRRPPQDVSGSPG
jgi:membrane protein